MSVMGEGLQSVVVHMLRILAFSEIALQIFRSTFACVTSFDVNNIGLGMMKIIHLQKETPGV